MRRDSQKEREDPEKGIGGDEEGRIARMGSEVNWNEERIPTRWGMHDRLKGWVFIYLLHIIC